MCEFEIKFVLIPDTINVSLSEQGGVIDKSILSAALGSNAVNEMEIAIETMVGAGGLFSIVSG